MSKQSFEYTDRIDMLRVVEEAGPLTVFEMAGPFKDLVKRGLIGSDGKLTDKGSRMLHEQDRVP